jgi:RHS repeat-associated protein
VTTNYSYDVLNRLTQKAYVGLSTSLVKFAYDGALPPAGCNQDAPTITSANSIGRRSAMCGQESGSSWSYDSMGRPLLEARINAGGGSQTNYSVRYTYYLDGALNTLTYPSGDVVTYQVGGAERPTQVTDSTNNYAMSAKYAPHGALASMTNGTGIATSNIYSDRLQPVLLSAGVSGETPVFSLCYDFHLGVAVSNSSCSFNAYTTGDNGNVFQVLNNVNSNFSAAYAYDPLNRISQANTTNTTSSNPNCWGEVYTIDAWGNLTNRAAAPGMAGTCSTEGLSATATTQNQLSGIGVVYDAAGNVANDGNGNTPTYDAENRIVTDAGVTYYYDADGARMEKSSGTKYWFGPGGEVLTEAVLAGTIDEEYIYFNGERIARIDRPSGEVHYYFSDHLGSASVITSPTAVVQETYYYYPYGGLLYSSGSDPNHYKFTGKEWDSESNLDNFGARYFTSTMGRFMTPDWAARPTNVPYAVFGDPQSLNLYGYVRNDPVSRADADGHCALSRMPIACAGDTHVPGGNYSTDQNQGQSAQNKSWWQKLAGIFYAKGSVGVALEVGVEAHVGKAKSPLKVGAKVGADVKSTMTVTTGGTSVSATKEAQAGVNVGKVILGPQTSTENVTVQNGVALANPEVEHSSSAMFGTERAEGTLSKGDFGVGAEIDAGVLVVGFEVGVDFDKVKDLFNPQ